LFPAQLNVFCGEFNAQALPRPNADADKNAKRNLAPAAAVTQTKTWKTDAAAG
jgi:hypothetical protein